MRTLLLVAALGFSACNCHPPLVIDAPDASEPEPAPDAGQPDAGTPADDGGVRFELSTTLPTRPRAIWSLNGQSVWVVGDGNSIYRFDSRGWVSVAPASGDGIDWREVRGDGTAIWALGERPDAGSFIYRSPSNDVRRIEAEGVSIQAPHFIAAHLSGLWVGGSDNGLGAVLRSGDFGLTWVGQNVPECPPVVGGFDYQIRELGEWWGAPTALLADSRLLHEEDRGGGVQTWGLTGGIASQPVRGPAFTYPDDDPANGWDAFILGESALLHWSGHWGYSNPYVTTDAILLDRFVPTALSGTEEDQVWAVGGATVVFRERSLDWNRVELPGEDLIGVHAPAASEVWLLSADGDVFHRTR